LALKRGLTGELTGELVEIAERIGSKGGNVVLDFVHMNIAVPKKGWEKRTTLAVPQANQIGMATTDHKCNTARDTHVTTLQQHVATVHIISPPSIIRHHSAHHITACRQTERSYMSTLLKTGSLTV
jgi:hypothetical protein